MCVSLTREICDSLNWRCAWSGGDGSNVTLRPLAAQTVLAAPEAVAEVYIHIAFLLIFCYTSQVSSNYTKREFEVPL